MTLKKIKEKDIDFLMILEALSMARYYAEIALDTAYDENTALAIKCYERVIEEIDFEEGCKK